MKFWLFYGGDAQGPYSEEELRRQPGFTQDALICPDGAASADEWKAARLYLSAAVSPRQAAASAPKPAAQPAAQAQPARGADAEDLFDKLKRERAQGGGGAGSTATAAAPAAEAKPQSFANSPSVGGSVQDGIDAMFAERRKAAQARAAAKRSAGAPPWLRKAALALLAAAVGSALLWGGRKGWQALQARRLAKKQAAGEEAAAKPAPETAAPAPAAAAPAAPKPDAGMALAIDFAKRFPLQSRSRKRPVDMMELFSSKRWAAPKTLGDLYEQESLEELGRAAQQRVELQGHDAAEAALEIKRAPELWRQHAEAFLAKGFRPSWSAHPNGRTYRVEVRRRGVADDEIRRFDVDPGAGSLKPLGVESWFDVDPKQAARWGNRYLRLSEDIDDNVAGPQTPTYTAKEGPPPAAKAPADEEEEAPSKAPTASARPRRGAAKPAAAKPDEDEYDDPTAAEDKKPAAQDNPAPSEGEQPAIKFEAARPAPAPQPKAAPPRPAPAPAPAAARPEPPADSQGSAGPPPPPQPGKAPKPKKSVSDMSVEELQQYLNR